METPYQKPRPKMWDGEEESVKRKSLNNEKRLSKKVGFKLTPGSGNIAWPTMKGDGQTERFMFEAKETMKNRISISAKVIEKLCAEAAAVGKDPILVISVYGMPEHLPKDWVAVPAEIWKEIAGK